MRLEEHAQIKRHTLSETSYFNVWTILCLKESEVVSIAEKFFLVVILVWFGLQQMGLL